MAEELSLEEAWAKAYELRDKYRPYCSHMVLFVRNDTLEGLSIDAIFSLKEGIERSIIEAMEGEAGFADKSSFKHKVLLNYSIGFSLPEAKSG